MFTTNLRGEQVRRSPPEIRGGSEVAGIDLFLNTIEEQGDFLDTMPGGHVDVLALVVQLDHLVIVGQDVGRKAAHAVPLRILDHLALQAVPDAHALPFRTDHVDHIGQLRGFVHVVIARTLG